MKLELDKIRTTVDVAAGFASDGKLVSSWAFGYVRTKGNAKGNEGTIITTNGDVGFEANFEIKESDKDSEFLIPMDRFKSLVRDFPQGEMNLTISADKILVKAKKSKYTMPTNPVADYNFLNMDKTFSKFSISASKLADALEKMKICTSSDKADVPELRGICISIEDDADIAGTNRRRVGYYNIGKDVISNSDKVKKEIIIPEFAINMLLPLLKNYSLNVDVLVSDKLAQFVFNNGYKVTTRIIDGKFPDYKKFVSLNMNPHEVVIIKNDLLNALKRCQGILKNNTINFKIKDKGLVISGAESDRGECEENIEIINKDGVEFEANYCIDYFIDGIKLINSDEIVIRLDSDRLKPIGITEYNGNMSYIYAMMGLRE